MNKIPKEEILKCRSLRHNGTRAEVVLWQYLRNRQICGLKFRRQAPVSNYVLDFYCPQIKLCIELDGEVHNELHTSMHDEQRTNDLNALGITVLRYSNDVVLKNIEGILKSIESFYHNPTIRYGWIKDEII